MKPGSTEIRITSEMPEEAAVRRAPAHRGTAGRPAKKGETAAPATDSSNDRMDAVAAHPLAELLECPPETGSLLNASARCLAIDAGDAVFRQGSACEGLYVVVSGQFVRKAERLQSRLMLGTSRAGDLVELAAALGEEQHTYTLSAQTSGSVLMLPIAALRRAFEGHPPLRMQLLEELAREVSRAYNACTLSRTAKSRRRSAATP